MSNKHGMTSYYANSYFRIMLDKPRVTKGLLKKFAQPKRKVEVCINPPDEKLNPSDKVVEFYKRLIKFPRNWLELHNNEFIPVDINYFYDLESKNEGLLGVKLKKSEIILFGKLSNALPLPPYMIKIDFNEEFAKYQEDKRKALFIKKDYIDDREILISLDRMALEYSIDTQNKAEAKGSFFF